MNDLPDIPLSNNNPQNIVNIKSYINRSSLLNTLNLGTTLINSSDLNAIADILYEFSVPFQEKILDITKSLISVLVSCLEST